MNDAFTNIANSMIVLLYVIGGLLTIVFAPQFMHFCFFMLPSIRVIVSTPTMAVIFIIKFPYHIYSLYVPYVQFDFTLCCCTRVSRNSLFLHVCTHLFTKFRWFSENLKIPPKAFMNPVSQDNMCIFNFAYIYSHNLLIF